MSRMTLTALCLALGVALGGCARETGAGSVERAAAKAALPAPEVLVVTETAGFHHDSIPAAVRAIRAVARASRSYRVTVLPHARELTPARLRHASAVVFLLTSGELPLSSAGKRNLLRFVRAGHGLVGFHSASDTFHSWPAYVRALGGEFANHPHRGVGRVIEEFYFFKTNPRRRAHVLARLDVASFGGSAHEDRPIVWCRREGRGRVFYDALGHNSTTWQGSRQRDLLAGGVAWALALRGARAGCP